MQTKNAKWIDEMFKDLFKNIVGQDAAKRKFNFYIDSYLSTRLVPNLMLVAPKGCGKTTIGKEFAKGLVRFDNETGQVEMKEDGVTPRKKTFVEVNCSTLKNVKQFINQIVIPFIQDKDVTVFFDEASEIPRDITMSLLTMLNPNPERRTTFSYEEYVIELDFRRVTFVFATSEIQKVFPPLIDRLKRIDLEEYTHDHLAKIVQLGAKEVDFRDDVLIEIASVTRGNARQAQSMAEDLLTYLKNRKVFNKKDWKTFCEIMDVKPLGLSPLELQVLRCIADSVEGTSLTGLASQTGMSRDSLQKDVEMYLQKHKLMDITTNGREITAKGIEYLRALDGTGSHAIVMTPAMARTTRPRPQADVVA